MPLYEYRCRTCDTVFEARRPMAESSLPAPCPNGHEDARRVLSAFASVNAGGSSSSSSSAAGAPAPSMGGGGCGSCACH